MNRAKLFQKAIVLVLVLCLVGCIGGGGDPTATPIPPTATPVAAVEPTATPQPPILTPTVALPPTATPQPTPASKDISLILVNASDVEICVVTAAISGTDDRSDNILEEALKPGDSYTFTDLVPVKLDLVALDCQGHVVQANQINLESGEATWEIKPAEPVVLEPVLPPPTSPDQVWLVMLYVDADDELLESDFLLDLNEAELVGSSDQVHIVAQVDRFEGGFAGDGDWASAKRYYVTQDEDLMAIGSEELADLGEVNMADGNTLSDFATWAIETYPADKAVLILSDHGTGWPGGWTDQSAKGDILTLPELEAALAQVQADVGLEQFELIGFDACLMSSLEVYAAIAPYTRYAVASEEVEPSLGWAYAGFLGDLVTSPGMSGADLAASIVRNYLDGDIVAQIASPEFIEDRKLNATLSAVDLIVIPDLLEALDELTIAASTLDQDAVARARSYAQSYENTFSGLQTVFGSAIPPSYLDLGHLAQVLAAEDPNAEIILASRKLLAILDQAVVAERHGPERPGSSGITLYFPNSMLYGAYDILPGSNVYAAFTERFALHSLWDDFLLFHYTGAPMPDAGAGVVAYASENATIVGPGVGQIQIAPFTASSDVFSIDNPIYVLTEVTGGHVAQVYIFAGRYDEEANAVVAEVRTYLAADLDKNVGGVVYPDWAAQTENGVLTLASELEAESLIVTDGTVIAFGTFTSEQYGGGNCFVPGIHTSAATGEQRVAVLRFNVDSTEMLNMLVFTSEGGASIPREYVPQPGDQFTLTLTLIDQETGETYYANGDTLTFGEQPFSLATYPSPPGQYVLGVTVVDLDGNMYNQSIMLTVTE